MTSKDLKLIIFLFTVLFQDIIKPGEKAGLSFNEEMS
jgi:hypothetical protein